MAKQSVMFLKEGDKFSVGSRKFTVEESTHKEEYKRFKDDNGNKRVWVQVRTDNDSPASIPFKITDNVEVERGRT